MGTRKKRERQESLWYSGELPVAPGHPFYQRLNEVLGKADFDRFCEKSCAGFYHAKLGRPSLPPGLYFRIMMIGFFEGLDSERGIAWRVADSLTLRQFLSIGLDEPTPDHVTISRTRRLIGAETHQRIFGWVLERLAEGGLIKGKTLGVDSTTREANAAMKSIVECSTRSGVRPLFVGCGIADTNGGKHSPVRCSAPWFAFAEASVRRAVSRPFAAS
jgi:transposase